MRSAAAGTGPCETSNASRCRECYKRPVDPVGGVVALHHILVLAIVQGLTEFLPISSSGHLILFGKVLGWPDQGLAIDVAVHVGSLVAVMAYFWRDVLQLFVGVGRLATGRGGYPAQLVRNIAVATVPVLIVGFLAKDYIATVLRDVEVIAWATLGFGVVLWLADKVGMTIRRMEHLGWGAALGIGLMQVLALIPGTSRSGITMTAGRLLGLERTEAARFSLLLSIPTIVAAGGLTGWDVYQAGDLRLGMDMAIAAGFSFLAALIAIAAMMSWLKHAGFGPFVLYRLALGGGLLWWAYGGGAAL